MTYLKPIPAADVETAPFWAACREHKLIIQRCRSCGHKRFPPTRFCSECQSAEQDWTESSGRGVIFSWIVVRHPVPKEAFAPDVPYIVALVDLEEGVRMPANLEGCAPEAVRGSMPVMVGFRAVTPDVTLPVFKPALED
jgi:uncharacterized OB-fold protein